MPRAKQRGRSVYFSAAELDEWYQRNAGYVAKTRVEARLSELAQSLTRE